MRWTQCRRVRDTLGAISGGMSKRTRLPMPPPRQVLRTPDRAIAGVLLVICASAVLLTGCAHSPFDSPPPTASAGADQVVNAGSSVTLDGSRSSDPDGYLITFSWSQTLGTPVSLSSTSSPMVTFTAPASGTTLVFDLTVSDGTSSSVGTVHVSVHPTGQATQVVEIRQRSIMDDRAVSGAFLNGWAPTPVPGAPPARSDESERAEEGQDNQQVAPIVEQDLSPGASGSVDLQVRGSSVLLGSARWIGTISPLNVTLSLDGATLATGKPYHSGPNRGGAFLQANTTAGGHATLSVTNTSGVRVKLRIVLAAASP